VQKPFKPRKGCEEPQKLPSSGEVSDSDEVTFNTAHWTKRDPEEVLGHTWAAV